MHNTLALSKRILQQFSHDPRTVVMFILAPILVLWLFSVMLGAADFQPRLAGIDLPDPLTKVLREQEVRFTEMDARAATGKLARQEIDAILSLDTNGILKVNVEGSNASHSGAVINVVNAALSGLSAMPNVPQNPEYGQAPLIREVAVRYLHGSEKWNRFDFFGPVFIGIFIFVFVFITSGMSLITERTGGTMDRLLATPIRSWQLVLGFSLGFGLVSLVQAAIVLWTCITLIDFPNEGALATVICVTFSLALVSLTLGLMVSGLARTPFQVIQMMLLLVVPQILLSGIFDLSQTPEWMRVLSVCLPITHGADALRDIMLRGASLADVAKELAILWAFIAAFFFLATVGFRRRRTGLRMMRR